MVMMNRTALLLILLLLAVATPLLADDTPKPDYSQDAMLRFAHEFVLHPQAKLGDFDLGNIGAVNVYKYGVMGKLLYLPFLAPLPGTRLADVATVPNAFALTNTRIARSMPYLPDELAGSPGVRKQLKVVLRLVGEQ
jgi:hypothetical protein